MFTKAFAYFLAQFASKVRSITLTEIYLISLNERLYSEYVKYVWDTVTSRPQNQAYCRCRLRSARLLSCRYAILIQNTNAFFYIPFYLNKSFLPMVTWQSPLCKVEFL